MRWDNEWAFPPPTAFFLDICFPMKSEKRKWQCVFAERANNRLVVDFDDIFLITRPSLENPKRGKIKRQKLKVQWGAYFDSWDWRLEIGAWRRYEQIWQLMVTASENSSQIRSLSHIFIFWHIFFGCLFWQLAHPTYFSLLLIVLKYAPNI